MFHRRSSSSVMNVTCIKRKNNNSVLSFNAKEIEYLCQYTLQQYNVVKLVANICRDKAPSHFERGQRY